MQQFGTIDIADMDEISQRLDKAGGVVTLMMFQVRDAYGARRLGSSVRENISAELDNRGIGHIPTTLPDSQDGLVRLYRRKSAVGKIIEASRTVSLANDQKLRDAAAGEAQIVLEKVRELVCE